jgi:hypothetical protein
MKGLESAVSTRNQETQKSDQSRIAPQGSCVTLEGKEYNWPLGEPK